MSIKGNSIFGSIDISSDLYVVGRLVEQGIPMYFIGTYEERRLPQYAFRSITDINSFHTLKLSSSNLRSTKITVSFKSVTESLVGTPSHSERGNAFVSRAVSQSEAANFQQYWSLSVKESNIPSDTLYSSVWYKVKSSDGYSALLFPLQIPRENRAGIPPYDSFGQYMYADLDISFIPKKYTSIWNNNRCRITRSVTSAIEIYISIIEGEYNPKSRLQDYSQKNCSDKLTSKSANCVFTDLTCNNNTGGKYCHGSKTCGECFGTCNNGGFCVMDNDESPNRWYCLNNSKKDQGRWSRDVDWKFYGLIVVSLLLFSFLILLYLSSMCWFM